MRIISAPLYPTPNNVVKIFSLIKALVKSSFHLHAMIKFTNEADSCKDGVLNKVTKVD